MTDICMPAVRAFNRIVETRSRALPVYDMDGSYFDAPELEEEVVELVEQRFGLARGELLSHVARVDIIAMENMLSAA